MTVVTTTICDKGGNPMPTTYELLSVDIERTVGRIPRCNLKLLDGDLTKGTFPISDQDLLAPGAEVTVKARYERKPDAVIFKGVVVRHGLDLSRAGSILNVELRDKAVALTQPRKSAVYLDLSDAEVITKLADAAGITSDEIADTEPTHPELVQYHATDWDFMVSRAEAQGLALTVTDGVFSLSKLAPAAGKKVHAFKLGDNSEHELLSVELEADGLHQVGSVQGLAWDLDKSAVTPAATAAPAAKAPGNLDGAAVARALGFADTKLSYPVPVDAKELKAWVSGRLARSRMSMIRGRIATRGFADVKLLDGIKLTKMGARFNGTSMVTGVRHRISNRGWQTDLQFGCSPDLFCNQPEVTEAPAAGLLPAVSGLQIGVVAPFETDPLGALRVKVILPGIDAATGTVWARLATPDAGNGRGYMFRPEPGDEVVVGFFNSDPRQPVILGAMFGKKNAAPKDYHEPTEANDIRGIFSRAGVTIGIVDSKKPMVFIETPAKNKIVFDDDLEVVQVSDQAGNFITLDSKGITITSAKDLTLDASNGNVVIMGKKVDVQ